MDFTERKSVMAEGVAARCAGMSQVTILRGSSRTIWWGKKVVGNLPEGYIRNVPLPRVPRDQSTFQSRVPLVHTIPGYYATPYVIPTYVNPRSIVESATYAFSPAWHTIAINT